MGLRLNATLAAALIVFAAPAVRADDERGRVVPGKFSSCKQSGDAASGDHVVSIALKDGVTYLVDDELGNEERRKIDAVVLPLISTPNADVVLHLNEKNLVVAVEKGRLKNELLLLGPAEQAVVKNAQQGDELKITSKGKTIYGKFDSSKNDGIYYQIPLGTKGDKRIYPERGVGTSSIRWKDIEKLENLSRASDQPAEIKKGPDVIDKLDLRVGDTVAIGFVKGRIVELTDVTIKILEWKSGGWSGERVFPRDSTVKVEPAALTLRRSEPVNNGAGEVVVDEEVSLLQKSSHLKIKATLWHDQKDQVLANATLVFAFGKRDENPEQLAREEWQLPLPLFYDERVTEEKNPTEAEQGRVTLAPGFQLVPAASEKAKPFIALGIYYKSDLPTLARVYDTAAANGDPELALCLAFRLFQLDPRSVDPERHKAMIVDSLTRFANGSAARALLEHVLTPDNGYRMPEGCDDKGNLSMKDQKDRAAAWKKQELELLARLPGAAAGDRGRRLFLLFQERQAELGEAVLKIFAARTGESIDSLLDFAISLSTHPTQEEQKRAEEAATVIRNLGEPALDELIKRVKQQGQAGLALAKSLDASRKQQPIPNLIDTAILELVRWKSDERRRALDRTLEEAKAAAQAKKWEEALAIVEKVLFADASHEEARKLATDYTFRVAELRRDQKQRGVAAALLRKVLDAKQRPPGSASTYARILLEVANEDLKGNCIRSGADATFEVVKSAQKDEVLAIALNVREKGADGWHPVRLDAKGEAVGWIAHELGTPIEGGAKFRVMGECLPARSLRRQLEEIRKYDAALDADCKRIDGELWLREAEAKYAEGKYKEAHAAYESARALVPSDPRLENAWKAWAQANLMLLGIFAGFIVMIVVTFALLAMRRQKRVRVAEFKYYGKDRARAEREIDGPASAPVEGADAPASEAPPA